MRFQNLVCGIALAIVALLAFSPEADAQRRRGRGRAPLRNRIARIVRHDRLPAFFFAHSTHYQTVRERIQVEDPPCDCPPTPAPAALETPACDSYGTAVQRVVLDRRGQRIVFLRDHRPVGLVGRVVRAILR